MIYRGCHIKCAGRHSDVIEGIELSNGENSEDSCEDTDDETGTINSSVLEEKPSNVNACRPARLEILNHVKINNTLETPSSTIKGFLKDSKNTELNFRKEDLRKVEEQLKLVFIEFYRKLRLLKNYR